MKFDDIIKRHEELDHELHDALSIMERSDKIRQIRTEIIKNQAACPHVSDKYNWTAINGKCPYCGFTFDRGRDY